MQLCIRGAHQSLCLVSLLTEWESGRNYAPEVAIGRFERAPGGNCVSEVRIKASAVFSFGSMATRPQLLYAPEVATDPLSAHQDAVVCPRCASKLPLCFTSDRVAIRPQLCARGRHRSF